MPINILAFETATPSGGVCLYSNGKVLADVKITGSQSHSRFCLSLAETLLQSAGMKWSAINGLATSRGPGSFTGVRIGLSIIKALGMSLNVPCIAVNTLDAMAFTAWNGSPNGRIVPIQDARMGEVYTAFFSSSATDYQRVSDDLILSPESLSERLEAGDLLSGEGATAYAEILGRRGLKLHRARPDRDGVHASAVALLAARELEADRGIDAAELTALYLRDPIQQPTT